MADWAGGPAGAAQAPLWRPRRRIDPEIFRSASGMPALRVASPLVRFPGGVLTTFPADTRDRTYPFAQLAQKPYW
jgi:hypothetical protein